MSKFSTKDRTIMTLAWLVSLVGIVGSLYFSDIKGLNPCLLCWYQRIALYPTGLILPLGIWRHERLAALYSLPLLFGGLLIALYQNLLVWHVIPVSPWCSALGSCAEGYINWLGFITIPFLSMMALLMMIILLWPVAKAAKQDDV